MLLPNIESNTVLIIKMGVTKNMNTIKAIDMFAGAGGLSLGMHWAGIDVAVASDIDAWCEVTYKKNNPNTKFLRKPIEELGQKELKKALLERGLKFNDIDIVAGGPPCQGFSIIGQRDPNDPRNKLFKHFVKLITWIKPKVFVMENVFGLLSMMGGAVAEEIVRAFTEAGYNVSPPRVLNAADYGVPQLRKRVFFIGVRKDLTDELLRYPTPTHDSNNYITLWEAISDLPENVVQSEEDKGICYPCKPKSEYQKWIRKNSKMIFGHHTKEIQETRKARIQCLREGQLRTSLPKKLQAGGYENKYRRLVSENPAPTLTAHMSKDLTPFIHPIYDRWLTTREAARIQSFTDDYIFEGSEFQKFKQIGNAVPPLLSMKLFQHLIDQLVDFGIIECMDFQEASK